MCNYQNSLKEKCFEDGLKTFGASFQYPFQPPLSEANKNTRDENITLFSCDDVLTENSVYVNFTLVVHLKWL